MGGGQECQTPDLMTIPSYFHSLGVTAGSNQNRTLAQTNRLTWNADTLLNKWVNTLPTYLGHPGMGFRTYRTALTTFRRSVAMCLGRQRFGISS